MCSEALFLRRCFRRLFCEILLQEIWLPIVEHLAHRCKLAGRSARVVAVDLPGCGDSRPIDFALPADWPGQILYGLKQVLATSFIVLLTLKLI